MLKANGVAVLIRWIKQSTEKSLELGLRSISARFVSMFSAYSYRSAIQQIINLRLLVQTTQLDQVSTTLILPGCKSVPRKTNDSLTFR